MKVESDWKTLNIQSITFHLTNTRYSHRLLPAAQRVHQQKANHDPSSAADWQLATAQSMAAQPCFDKPFDTF